MDRIIDIWQICFSSFCVYLFIILAIRIFGKKDLAQLSVVDVVFILLISNAVQNAMVGPDTTLIGGLAAASTLFITNYVFKKLLHKFPKLSRSIQGKAVMLVYNGRVIDENMHKTDITFNELMESIREHGVTTIKDVNLAVLELDGNISILSNDFANRSNKKRKINKKLRQQD